MDVAVRATENNDAAKGPWPLPVGWCWVPLGEVLDPISTIDPKRAYGQQSFHYIDLSALQDGHVTKAQLIAGDEAPSRARQIVQPGDTLFSCVRVYLENIALLDSGLSNPVASTAYCVMRPSAAVDPRYLNYLVRSRRFIEWMIPLQRGNSPPAVLDGDLKAQNIPIAPLAEQRRVVTQVDALFAEIAEGEAALIEARKGLDILRRALLKAAVTGELTEDWRAANPATESGHDLLARIKTKRTCNGSPKARARRAIDANPLDTSSLPELPYGWVWATVRDIADVIGGLTKNPDREKMPERAPYLRVANVQAGSLDLSEIKEIGVTAEDRQRASLKSGDLLVVEGNGSIDQIGRCALWDAEIANCVHQNHIIKVRFADKQLPRWCFKWLLSPHGRQEIEQVAASTSGLHTLSISKVEALPVPVPPPAEAVEILRRLSDALSATADTLAMFDIEAADSARLKQSILKAAFEGRLAPQDPADEPAGALLARVAASAPAVGAKRGRARKSNV